MRSILAASAAIGLLVGAAHAQAGETSVALGPLWEALSPYLADALAAIATALLGMIYAWVRAKFGMDIEARHREALHSAVVTGINLGMAKAGARFAGRHLQAGSPAVTEAMAWVARSVPDALAHFGVSPEGLEKLVLAKAQQLLGAAPADAALAGQP